MLFLLLITVGLTVYVANTWLDLIDNDLFYFELLCCKKGHTNTDYLLIYALSFIWFKAVPIVPTVRFV